MQASLTEVGYGRGKSVCLEPVRGPERCVLLIKEVIYSLKQNSHCIMGLVYFLTCCDPHVVNFRM